MLGLAFFQFSAAERQVIRGRRRVELKLGLALQIKFTVRVAARAYSGPCRVIRGCCVDVSRCLVENRLLTSASAAHPVGQLETFALPTYVPESGRFRARPARSVAVVT